MIDRHRPDLFVLCIDSLRADCLEGGGAWSRTPRPSTPALDAFARGARAYRRAYSASSWTKPSVPSMFLSRYPAEHGVYEVAKDVTWETAFSASLPDDIPTLAERLKEAGYRTLAVAHNAQLDPTLGFARGFDVFLPDAGRGDTLVERVAALDPWGEDPRPVFLYVHLIEPHWPFAKPISTRAKGLAAGRFPFHRLRSAQWKALKQDLKHRRVELTGEEIEALRGTYAVAVEEADRVAGKLLAMRDEAARPAGPAFTVVTADHGEELLDHGLVGHGQSLHEELIRVPLLLRPGGSSADGFVPGKTDELASLLDLAPTLLGAAGVDPAEESRGRDLLRAPAPEHVFCEVKHKRRYSQGIIGERHKLVREFRFRRSRADRSATDYNNLQELFAERERKETTRLFDLGQDPTESHDLSATDTVTARRLAERLDSWWSGLSRRASSTRAIEDDMIRRLEALGYL